MSYLYKFSVDETKEIDIDRIIRENMAELTPADALLITSPQAECSILLLAPQLLARFDSESRLNVAGQWLAPKWGNPYAKATGRSVLMWSFSDVFLATGWRARRVATDGTLAIVNQLAAARAALTAFTVKIHSL